MNNKDSNVIIQSIGWTIMLLAYFTMHFELNIPNYLLLGIAIFSAFYSYGDHYTKELMNLGIKHKYFDSYAVGRIIRNIVLTLSFPATFLLVFYMMIKKPSSELTDLATTSFTLFALGITFLSVSTNDSHPPNSN